MKYKAEYMLDGYKFIFSSNDCETLKIQNKHINKFYIEDSKHNKEKEVFNIEVLEDPYLFNQYIKLCDGLKAKTYQSFENEFHNEYSYENNKIFILDNQEYMCIKKDDNNYLVVSDGSDKSIKWPFRVVREILVRLEEDENKLFMHGTGVSINEKGVLLLGGSGSGKTSLATKIIESNENIGFYSNDRMFINTNENNQTVMNYFPIPIVYAMGTVKNSYNLDRYFREYKILEKEISKSYEESNYCDKVGVPLTKMNNIFKNVELKANGNTDLIIFPKLIKEYLDDNSRLITFNNEEKRILLEQTCFTPFDWESLRFPWIYKRKNVMNDIIAQKHYTLNKVIRNTEIVGLEYGFNVNPKKLVKEINKII